MLMSFVNLKVKSEIQTSSLRIFSFENSDSYMSALMNAIEKTNSFQHTEISKMEWKTYNESLDLIRPYNLEKKDVLQRVNKLLSDYRLYP